MNRIFEFLPIITTVLAFVFTYEMLRHYRKVRTKYLLWWTIGILNYGLGNMCESINILWGWSAFILKFWYITGALLGGFFLAQGTVYFLLSEKFANRSAAIWLLFAAVTSVFIILTPVSFTGDGSGRMSGDMLEWQWIRYFTPFINLYAFLFSFGGAVYAANQYFQQINKETWFAGCIYISAGTLVPGLGGIYTKIGYTNILYITSLVGLCFIYRGYRIIRLNEAV